METTALLPGVEAGATVLFVHAHPDDETLVTGATMAAAAAAGAHVVLVTCTRGELGEVIPPELAHLEVKAEDLAEDLAAGQIAEDGLGSGLALEREKELAAALQALGVQKHIWLGQDLAAPAQGPTTFRDSGMQWGPDGRAIAASTILPGSFSRAPLNETAALLAATIRTLRPAAVISYAADGGYGHPDHVRTHELTMVALRQAAAGDAAWQVPHLYAIVSDRPERPLEDGVARLAVTGDLAAKTAAMRAHRTQITVEGERYALSDDVWKDISAVEEFVAIDPHTVYELP